MRPVSRRLYAGFDIGHPAYCRKKRGEQRMRASPHVEERRASRGRNGKANLAAISTRSLFMLML